MFKWLNCYYLKKTYEHVKNLRKNGSSSFEVRNNSQTYLARTLSLVYAEVGRIFYNNFLNHYLRIVEKIKFKYIKKFIF